MKEEALTRFMESVNASNGSCPSTNEDNRQNHLRGNATMHTHEDGPFRVLVHATGTMLVAIRNNVSPRTCFILLDAVTTHEIPLQLTRVTTIQMELGIA
jgi:hypothetical protein